MCGGGEELKKIKYKDKRKFPCSHHPAVVTIYILVSYKSFFNVYIFLIKKGIIVLFRGMFCPFPVNKYNIFNCYMAFHCMDVQSLNQFLTLSMLGFRSYNMGFYNRVLSVNYLTGSIGLSFLFL